MAMIGKFRNYIFTGLLVVLPIALSVAITIWLFKLLTNWIFALLPSAILSHKLLKVLVRLSIPVVFVFILMLIGMFARIVFIRKIFALGEKILVKIPLFNKIYISVKQLSEAIIPSDKNLFNRVVLVQFPQKGSYSLGFVTSKAKGEIQKKTREEVVNVFVPTTPNPTSGFLMFIPENDLIGLEMSVEDGLKLVISGGAVMPVNNLYKE
jgi:uncharacterized membrane protein